MRRSSAWASLGVLLALGLAAWLLLRTDAERAPTEQTSFAAMHRSAERVASSSSTTSTGRAKR